MKEKELDSIDIIVDTKEKKPWNFEGISKSIILNITHKALKTGDYTIAGLEDVLAIERKGSLMEFVGNIVQPRFKNELERMREFKYRYLFLQFDLGGISKWDETKENLQFGGYAHKTITTQFIMRYISEIQTEYNIQTVFCGNRYFFDHQAQHYALNIMRRVYEHEKRK